VIVRTLWQFVLLSLAAAGCWSLTSQFGSLLAGAVWSALALVGCVVGVVLLRTSELSRVTWKNRVAGWLIPWGWRINRGKLWPVAVVSWVVWMLVWAAVAVLTPPASESLTARDVAVRVLLGVAWAVDGLAIGYVIGTLRQNFTSGASGGHSLRVIAVVITGLLAVSVALHLFGLTTAGLLVAGGQPLLVGGGYGLFLAVLLVFGRNSRWN
jgi:hypothetical protein